MPKRASLDIDQFRVELPPQPRDPLDSVIPSAPQPAQQHTIKPEFASSHRQRIVNQTPIQAAPTRSEAGKPQRSEVTKSGSPEVRKLRSYELRKFDELRRLDIRITGEQKRFLDDLEEDIRQAMPEGDRGNPDYQRITKNSIIRALLEIARQLNVRVDAKTFHNENDLLHALFAALARKLPNSRSSGIRK